MRSLVSALCFVVMSALAAGGAPARARADVLYVEGQIGPSYTDLVSFNDSNFLPQLGRMSGWGPAFGLGAGLKLAIVTVGARGTFASYPDFGLGTIGLDVAIRPSLLFVAPYLRAGLGYAWVSTLDGGDALEDRTSVYGLEADLGLGLDLLVGPLLAVGVGVDAMYLNLTRQEITDGCDGSECNLASIDFQESGDAAGISLRANVHARLRF